MFPDVAKYLIYLTTEDSVMISEHMESITLRYSPTSADNCHYNSHEKVLVGATNRVPVVHLVGLDGLRQSVHDEFSRHVQRKEGGGEALDGLDVGAEVPSGGSIRKAVSRVER